MPPPGFLGGGVALKYGSYSDIMRLSCVGSGILYELLHQLETIDIVRPGSLMRNRSPVSVYKIKLYVTRQSSVTGMGRLMTGSVGLSRSSNYIREIARIAAASNALNRWLDRRILRIYQAGFCFASRLKSATQRSQIMTATAYHSSFRDNRDACCDLPDRPLSITSYNSLTFSTSRKMNDRPVIKVKIARRLQRESYRKINEN